MSSKRYHHIFIDLDKTLWDFDSNARKTFEEILNKYDLEALGVDSLDSLLKVYTRHNDLLWGHYRKNEIKKEVLNIRRFEWTLNDFGIDDLILATDIAEDYITLSPRKTIMFPGVIEGLSYLKGKYQLHMITNGFEEVQQQKLDNCDLRRFFTTITTSEEAGVKKPNRQIFDYALNKAGASPQGSVMIGDDMKVDIEGARSVGMDQVFFNPLTIPHNGSSTFEFKSWDDIQSIL
jgi:putative hydrolase of the HAD superfamily